MRKLFGKSLAVLLSVLLAFSDPLIGTADTAGSEEWMETENVSAASPSNGKKTELPDGMGFYSYPGTVGGYIGPDFEPDIVEQEETGLLAAASLPSSYDTRASLPAARDQGKYSACWSFATIALAEASMIKKGKAGKNVDYSELALAYFSYDHPNDPLGLTELDWTYIKTTSVAEPKYLNLGGNPRQAAFALSGWVGPIDETEARYPAKTDLYPPLVLSKDIAYHNQAVLKNAYHINPKDTSMIKQVITDLGAISLGLYISSGTSNITTYTESGNTQYYYYSDPVGYGNHAVTFVGWDDTVPAERFLSPKGKRPSSDGAWLCRNSWGTAFADNGYFWVSYEDPNLECFTGMEFLSKDQAWDHNYYYDGSLNSSSISLGECGYIGNVFRAKDQEVLKAINLGIKSTNTTCVIQIFKNSSQMNHPLDGQEQLPDIQIINTRAAGLLTIDLDYPVLLEKDEYFSVFIMFPDGADIYLDKTEQFSDLSFWNFGNTKESFYAVTSKSTLIDCFGLSSVRLKAFTDDAEGNWHKISYEMNGYGEAMPVQTGEAGEKIKAPADPSEDNLIFGGWFKDAKCTVPWDFSSDIMPASDLTLYAKWNQAAYTVQWLNEDGSLLKSESVAYGTTPEYTGTTPQKTATAEYSYTFAGWTPAVVAVTANATYRATFTEKKRTYTATVQSANTSKGTVSAETVRDVPYGSVITASGTTLTVNGTAVTATAKSGYKFSSWSGIPTDSKVVGDVTITANFTASGSGGSSGGGGSSSGGGGSSSGGGGGGGSSSGLKLTTSATTGTFSSFWKDVGNGVWKITNNGQYVTSAWLCDDAVSANGQNVWYLMNTDGTMLAAGLVQDNTGNFYSLETTHNGYYGMLRYKNGTYDCNGQQVYLEFSNKHDGTFGAVTNAEGLAKLQAIYGVTKFNIGNDKCQYTSTFK